MRALATKALAAVMVVVFCAALSPMVAAEEGPPVPSDARVRPAGQTPGQTSLAEQYLFRLAEKSRKRRRLAGGFGLGVGVLSIAGGLALLSEDDEDDWLHLAELSGYVLVTGGAVCVLGGAISLAVVSPPEKAYKRTGLIQDPAARERACAEALASLAKKARRTRMIGGGISCAAGVLGVLLAEGEDSSSGPVLSAAYAGTMALYFFLVKSPAERTYRAYLAESRVSTVPDLILGFGPRGGFRVGLSMDF